jgi:CO/xanthine dehydrogenase Mo-binding subunit
MTSKSTLSSAIPNGPVGQSIPRVDGPAKVKGLTRYTADIDRPGILWGKVLRSPLPHARILHINTSRAQNLPGVKAVITAHDVSPRLVGASLKDMPVLARDRVRYVGEEVAAVAAVDSDTAEEAIALINVEYEELPAVFDPLEAMKPDAPIIHPDYATYEGPRTKAPDLRNVQSLVQGGKGDIEKGFAESEYIFENVFQTQMVHQGYIEPHACLVEVDGNGRVAVWSSNQGIFKLRKELAEYLGLQEAEVIVHPANIGGSFGAKDNLVHVPVAYYLSSLSGRPVKFVNTYSEEFLASSPRHPAVIFLRVGVRKDGVFLAWEGRTFYNGGAYGGYKPKGWMTGAYAVVVSYSIPHTRLQGYCVYTNQIPCGYYRAPGEPQTLFAVESHVDFIAEQLGLDRLELRMRNALQNGDTRGTGERLEDPHCKEVLQRLAKVSDWSRTRVRRKRQHLFGRGMALGDRHVGTGESSCELILDTNGDLCLRSGIGDQGVGAYTMHRQVVSQIVGVHPDRVHINVSATDSAPYDEGIKGARGMHVEGRAVAQASEALVEAVCAAAASHWRTSVSNISWSRDKAILKKSKSILSLHDLARLSTSPIRSFGHYKGDKSGAYSFQALVADVAVDTETGQVSVIQLYFVYDVTTVVNPLIHQGQLEGAIIQGLGYALCEDMGIEDGRVMVSNFGDYKICCVRDVPPLVTSFVNSTVGPGPFSAKAVGEAGIGIVAPAIANAVCDATGVRITQLPITPEKIIKGLTSRGFHTRAKQDINTLESRFGFTSEEYAVT